MRNTYGLLGLLLGMWRVAPAQDAMALLIGRWNCGSIVLGQPVTQQVTFSPTNYISVIVILGTTVVVGGSYQAQMLPGNQVSLHVEPKGWSPRQVCDPIAGCKPIQFWPEDFLFAVVSQDLLRSQSGACQRTQ